MKTIYLCILLLILSSVKVCAQSRQTIAIIYDSKSGHTKLMAEAVAKGARAVSGVQVRVLSVNRAALADVRKAQAIIIGSPVYNANMTPELQSFINSWPHDSMRNKLGAAFVSAGGISAGQESTLLNILRTMLIFRMIVIGGEAWQAPFGAAAVVNELPFQSQPIAPQFLQHAAELGKRVAITLKTLHT